MNTHAREEIEMLREIDRDAEVALQIVDTGREIADAYEDPVKLKAITDAQAAADAAAEAFNQSIA